MEEGEVKFPAYAKGTKITLTEIQKRKLLKVSKSIVRNMRDQSLFALKGDFILKVNANELT